MVKCTTLVDTDDEAEARGQVDDLFEGRQFPQDAGKCVATIEAMGILTVSPSTKAAVGVWPNHEH